MHQEVFISEYYSGKDQTETSQNFCFKATEELKLVEVYSW